MNGYLVDTNVVSEFTKPMPSARVIRWLESVESFLLFASVITLGELRMGLENLPPSKKRTDLQRWVETGLPQWFDSNLLPVTKQIADRWGRITIASKRNGVLISTADGLIAATALEHDLTLVTRNVKDFSRLSATILNPWD